MDFLARRTMSRGPDPTSPAVRTTPGRETEPSQPADKQLCGRAGERRWDARRANPEESGVQPVRRKDEGWSATQRIAFFTGLIGCAGTNAPDYGTVSSERRQETGFRCGGTRRRYEYLPEFPEASTVYRDRMIILISMPRSPEQRLWSKFRQPGIRMLVTARW